MSGADIVRANFKSGLQHKLSTLCAFFGLCSRGITGLGTCLLDRGHPRGSLFVAVGAQHYDITAVAHDGKRTVGSWLDDDDTLGQFNSRLDLACLHVILVARDGVLMHDEEAPRPGGEHGGALSPQVAADGRAQLAHDLLDGLHPDVALLGIRSLESKHRKGSAHVEAGTSVVLDDGLAGRVVRQKKVALGCPDLLDVLVVAEKI